MHHNIRPPAQQRGVATVLILLLVGLSLSAAALGTAHYIRSQQQQDIATHAQTQAQMKAWTGAELVRQYLQKLQIDNQLSAFYASGPSTLTLTGDGVTGAILADITAIDATAGTVTARIIGITAPNSPAEARALLEVVYAASASAAPAQPRPAVLTYRRNLRLSGSIRVEKDTGSTTAYEISVEGDISTGGNSIDNVDNLLSTGSISIGSGSSFKLLHANCDVNLSGSVTAINIKARRNVCAIGTAGTGPNGAAMANGSIDTKAGIDRNGTLSARANPEDVGSCNVEGFTPLSSSTEAATCATPSVVGVNLSGGSAGADKVETKGNVSIQSGKVNNLQAQGNLTVVSSATISSGTVGGTVSKPGWNGNVNVNETKGFTTNPPLVALVKIDPDTFKADDVKPVANYVFTIDSAGFKKVKVQSVDGMADGEYFLGDYDGGGYKDYLCKTVTGTVSAPKCATPVRAESKTICKGQSEYNNCFTYSASTGWKIDGKSMAPGIAWFQGDLEVSNGTYFNTFVATGNIKTSGSHKTYAPNYAGYNGQADGKTYAPQGICSNSDFPALKPQTFCAGANYKPEATGNYALMAGNRTDGNWDDLTGYQGGTITVGASSEIFGDIRAGNEFQSGGDTIIHGYVSALALGVKVINSLGGSTKFDLRDLPKTFSPGGSASQPSGGGTPAGSVQMKWSRYL